MSVYKRGKGTHWHYYFRVRGVRYRGSIPEARTKQKAEQAESKIKQEIFEKRFESNKREPIFFQIFSMMFIYPGLRSTKNHGAMMSIWSRC
jgi:hypothetical protein